MFTTNICYNNNMTNTDCWLSHSDNSSTSVHIMCDNQYAIKACRKHQKPYHSSSLNTSDCSISPNITVHFHWIHGHTNNKFHCQVDSIATHTLTIHNILKQNTDALASGGANNPLLLPAAQTTNKKKKTYRSYYYTSFSN